MIDATNYTLHGSVPTGMSPAHIIVSPDGKMVYTTNGGDNTVSAIDATTMRAVATIPVGAYPHGLRPSPDGRWVYVANAKGTTVTVIDTASNTVVSVIDVGQRPVQVAFSPDGTLAYVSLNGEDAIAKIDVATRTLVGKVQVGVGPIQVYVSPDNRYLLAANQGTADQPSTTVSMIETAGFKVVETIEAGQGAHGVVIDPSSRTAYITNIYGNDVVVLDLASREVTARIPSDAAPNGISWSPLPPVPASVSEINLSVPEHDEDMPAMEH